MLPPAGGQNPAKKMRPIIYTDIYTCIHLRGFLLTDKILKPTETMYKAQSSRPAETGSYAQGETIT